MRRALRWLDRKPGAWLGFGMLLLFATEVRSPVAVLAWIAPLPCLRYLRLTPGWRPRLLFGVALFAAWTLATAKIASEPRILALAPLFALPIAISQVLAYLTWDRLRTRVAPWIATCVFAVGLASTEWVLHHFTPFGSWGATAYTQLDDLPLLQVASVAGIAGVAILVNATAAAIESALASDASARPTLAAVLTASIASHAAGTVRLALADVAADRLVTVATVDTDSDVGGLPLPSKELTHDWDRVLLSRTEEAARSGAALAVWPEAATLVWPEEEEDWDATIRSAAMRDGIDIVAAYVVPESTSPFVYRNEFRVFLHDGTVAPPYAKHHPVPGEPARAGVGPAPIIAREWGRLSGAICYDYDFPRMARDRAGADVVAVPASDWRGIDPVHAQMAAVRAIESGHSVVRATRFGLSLAVDPYGRVRGWRSAFEPGAGEMITQVPRSRVSTPYAFWGDAPLAGGVILLSALIVQRLRRRSIFSSGAVAQERATQT